MANNNTDTGNGNAMGNDGNSGDSGMRSRADTLSAPVAGSETNSQQEGAGTARQGGFASASPESNVNPPGAPQSSHGSASGAIPGGTGARGSESQQSGMGAAAAGGNPGTSAGSSSDSQQGKITGITEGDEVEKLAARDEGGAGGADSR